MNDTLLALTGYISWTMVLLLSLALYRSSLVLTKQHGMKFNADGSDVPPLGHRITRAFANCVESFAFIGGLMLLALATDNQAITNGLALWLLAARIGQSVVHLISTSPLAIQLRFAFFIAQFVICVNWCWGLFQSAG